MVKDPFKKWDRVDTFCALLVDLGMYTCQHTEMAMVPLNYSCVDILNRLFIIDHLSEILKLICDLVMI